MKLFKFLILSVDVLYLDALFLFVLLEIYLGFRNNQKLLYICKMLCIKFLN